MVVSVSKRCQAIIKTLKTLSDPDRQKGESHHMQVIDDLVRFALWIGEVGALRKRSLLQEDVVAHVLDILNDLNKAAVKLLENSSGEREGEIGSNNGYEEDQNEITELLKEIGACVTRLFGQSRYIRKVAPIKVTARCD